MFLIQMCSLNVFPISLFISLLVFCVDDDDGWMMVNLPWMGDIVKIVPPWSLGLYLLMWGCNLVIFACSVAFMSCLIEGLCSSPPPHKCQHRRHKAPALTISYSPHFRV